VNLYIISQNNQYNNKNIKNLNNKKVLKTILI